MYGVWKIIQLNINSWSQIVQKFLAELKSQGELISEEPQYIGSPLAFLGKKHCPSIISAKFTLLFEMLQIKQFHLSSNPQIFSTVSREF